MDEWIGIDAAADLLGVSASTVRSDIAADRLRHRDLGKRSRPRWLVSRVHVERTMAQGGRVDRRALTAERTEAKGAENQAQEEIDSAAPAAEQVALALELDKSRDKVAELEAEVARLKLVARNANVAVQTQTESLQQFLLEDSQNGHELHRRP